MDLEPMGPQPLPSEKSPSDSVEESRIKSSQRLQYEAQVQVIRRQIGDLEKVRNDLGLSQRKMAQLLLVDPSAWTRWNRPGEVAPPHVWRSLQWYLTVREKIPGLTPQYFLGGDSRASSDAREQRISQVEKRLQDRIAELEEKTRRLSKWTTFWIATTFLLLIALVSVMSAMRR